MTRATLVLRRMADFAAVNAAYGSLFPDPLPPARVTVAAGALLWRNRDDLLGDVYAARVTVEGDLTVADPSGIAIASGEPLQGRPTVTASAGGFAVGWADGTNRATTGRDSGAARGQGTGAVTAPPEHRPEYGPRVS